MLSLWWLRRRRRQVSTSRELTEPTPFAELGSSSPAFLEKRERDPLTREQAPMIFRSHLLGSSLTVEDGPPQPPPISDQSMRSREEELSGIRTEIEELRRFMQSTRIEPETRYSVDLGAPPDYSSSRGDSCQHCQ